MLTGTRRNVTPGLLFVHAHVSRQPLYVGRLYTPVLDRVKYLLHCVAINDVLPPREGETYPPSSDYATKNYPPPGDSMYFFCNV